MYYAETSFSGEITTLVAGAENLRWTGPMSTLGRYIRVGGTLMEVSRLARVVIYGGIEIRWMPQRGGNQKLVLPGWPLSL